MAQALSATARTFDWEDWLTGIFAILIAVVGIFIAIHGEEKIWPGVDEASPTFSLTAITHAQTRVVCEVERQPTVGRGFFHPTTAGVAYVAKSPIDCTKFKVPVLVWTLDRLMTGQKVKVMTANAPYAGDPQGQYAVAH